MMNVHGKFKSSLLPVMLVIGVLLAVLVIADGFSPGFTSSAKMNVTNVSVVGKLTGTGSGTQGFMMQWVNVSGTMFFNVTMNASNGTVANNQSWNITNISLMFRHNQNESIMGNFTATNSTVSPGMAQGMSPIYWNISVATTTLPDGIYNLFVLVSNFTVAGAVGAGANPVTNSTLAINVTVDNSPPNVSVAASNNNSGQNLTLGYNDGSGNEMVGFNITANDPSFYYLQASLNGTNLANVSFSFNNASATVGFNLTVGNGGAGFGVAGGTAQGNMTQVNSTTAIFNVSVNLSALHAGEHTIRIFAYNYNGKLNDSITLNFTLNHPHNVTYMSSNSGEVVTQFANFSAKNTSLMFNVSVINATNTTSSFPNAPIFAVIAMFDNASGNDFNLSNGTNRFSDLNIARVGYWNMSYNVSALAEGNNTVTFFVNDTLGNHNKTTRVSFFVDKTAPALTITCSPSEPKEGETVSCTCSASDSGTGLKSDARFAGGTASESTVASGIGQHDTSLCSAEDYSFNRNEKKGSYTVVSAASGGSGGGGSGGGVSSSTGTSGVKSVWASINAGETAKVVADKPGLAVTSVEVKVDKTVYGAWVAVKSVERTDLPSAASSQLGGRVYDLIEITENKNALKGSVVTERTVGFKVEKSWLSENSLDKSDVALLRFSNNVWTALSTSVTKEDDKVVEYKATVPGFSYFAVGDKSVATAVAAPLTGEEKPATSEPKPAASAPTTTKPVSSEGRSLTWLWVVLVLAAVGVVVYFVKKRR